MTILVLHFFVLGLLVIFGLHRYTLLKLTLKHRKSADPSAPPPKEYPKVTVQLPIYNERYVVRRLIDHVCRLDYPSDRLEIQVLDDSDDDTSKLIQTAVLDWQQRNINIIHVQRAERTGFKAGALDYGMQIAKGELIAIFDADFIPEKQFLKTVVCHFERAEVGMVQARWEHINRSQSLLTRAQAILLDGHFQIEHFARNRAGLFFNFNGTAGIWRKACISSAGGWQHDTITEDLDLSYRAQLKGWKFIYLRDLSVPAELPGDMNAFKTQQHRWAKGSIQVARKQLKTIIKSEQPWRVKLEAVLHLTNNFAYVLLAIMSLLMPLAIRIRVQHDWHEVLYVDLPIFLGATLSVFSFYLISQRSNQMSWARKCLEIPIAMAIGIGLAVNNTRAVFEACIGHQSPFARTPKLALSNGEKGHRSSTNQSYKSRFDFGSLVEVGLGLIYLQTLIYCCVEEIYPALPFMGLFAFGFLYTAASSIQQSIRNRSQSRRTIQTQQSA
ncbi:MAG: glycosyltransferase [Myxococcota bacterium]|nr:glycosyltransferase [Myxococcota bacterium]